MPSFFTSKVLVALVAALSLSADVAAGAAPHKTRHPGTSKVKRGPEPLVSPVPGCSDETAQTNQPAFDFDTDSCYNSPAVDSDGKVNPGIEDCDVDVPCREPAFLEKNNVYYRARSNNGWTALLYGYYFEIDFTGGSCSGGHIHDWEHVVVWLEGSESRYVAASAHGDYDVRPVDEVLWDGSHPKIVYHKDGGSTHAMRFAKEDDDNPVENHNGQWFYGDLVGYNGFPSDEVRSAMLDNDWGKGTIDFHDDVIAEALEKAKGGFDIPLDTSVNDGDESRPC